MNFKTETTKRLAEVLEALKMRFEYYEEENLFVGINNRFLIYEEYENLSDLHKQFPDYSFIQISGNGSLHFEKDNNEVCIKHCKDCLKFFFTAKDDEELIPGCVFCDSKSTKYLTRNGRIPGWYGKKKESLIDEKTALSRLENFDFETQDMIKRVLERLTGTPKHIEFTPEKTESIKELSKRYPNMGEVIDYILQCSVTSQFKKDKAFSFRPFVLVGGPACGKTSFVSALAECIQGKRALKIDLGNGTANFTFSGSDPSFKMARPGLIIESMFSDKDKQPLKNPIIHFDELDKVKSEATYSIETLFYAILEKCNARNFFDSYVGCNVDVSGINYIFTANTLENIPAPIISRLRIFYIPDYTHEQLLGPVLDSFYSNWLTNNNMEADFLPAVLSEEIKEQILEISKDDPRCIEDAIGKVFTETLHTDQKSGCQIALFSPKEIYLGWEKFRGHKRISSEVWKLPEGFINQKKELAHLVESMA